MFDPPVMLIFGAGVALFFVLLGTLAAIGKIMWRIQNWRFERRCYACEDCGVMYRGDDLSGAYVARLDAVIAMCPACLHDMQL